MTKRCTKGKSCGDTCIDPRERCVLELGPDISSASTKVKNLVEKRANTGGAGEAITVSKRPPREVEKQGKNDKVREEYVKNKQDGMIKAYDKNAELAEKIRPQDPKGLMEIVSTYLDVTLSQNVSGFLVSTEVVKDNEGHIEIGYKVDGSFDAGKVKDRKDQVRVAMAAKNQYQTVINSLKDGSVVVVYPNQEDGKGPAREKAYAKLGFVPNDEGDAMYGIVKNGKVVSPDEDDDFGYAEEEKESQNKEVGVWLQIITGEEKFD